jgi:transposase
MSEIIPTKIAGKRRRFSADFKAQIVAACNQPGASVALANGLNANLVHKWRRLAKDKVPDDVAQPDFLPVPLARDPGSDTHNTHLLIEVSGIKVHWPLQHMDRAIAWLRALQS